MNGKIMNDSIELPKEDARIIRDMFTELICYAELKCVHHSYVMLNL